MSLKAQAYVWVNPHVTYVRNTVTATVVNTYARPLVCSGYVYGRTLYGATLNSWMNNIVVWPGSYANAYVYGPFTDPFVNAWSNIRCYWYY